METAIRKCISCDASISEKAKFCNKCGEKVEHTPEVEVTIKCPGKNGPCGNKLTVKDLFCMDCGFKVDHSLFKTNDPVQIPDHEAVISKEHGEDHADTKTEMTETTGSTTDSGSVMAEDQTESGRQVDSMSSTEPGEETQKFSVLDIQHQGNEPKKKTQEINSSKPDTESENVPKQISSPLDDTSDDPQISAQAKPKSDEKSSDHPSSNHASGQDTSNQTMLAEDQTESGRQVDSMSSTEPGEETQKFSVLDIQHQGNEPKKKTQEINSSKPDTESENVPKRTSSPLDDTSDDPQLSAQAKPKSDEKSSDHPSSNHAYGQDTSNQTMLAEDQTESGRQVDSMSSTEPGEETQKFSVLDIQHQGNEPKKKTQEINSSKPDTESENVPKQTSSPLDDTSDDPQISAQAKQKSDEKSSENHIAQTEKMVIVQVDSKKSLEMLQKNDSTQGTSNPSNNNSNISRGNETLDLKPDESPYKMVFGNGKNVDNPVTVIEHYPHLERNDAENQRTSDDNICYPPEINDNNSNLSGGNETHNLKPDGPNNEMVFDNGKKVDQPVGMDKNNSQLEKNDAEKQNVQLGEKKEQKFPDYPKFKGTGKKKKNKDQKPPDSKKVTQSGQSKLSQNNENQSRQTRSTANDVEIMFHVIISDNHPHEPDKEDIYIAFDPVELGHWKTDIWKMTKNRNKEDYYGYSLSVKMPKHLRNKGFQYKYVFVKKKNINYETVHFMQVRTRKDDPNREFNLPYSSAKQSSELWHQYDGFVYHPKSSEPWYSKAVTAVKEFIYKDMKEKAKNDTSKAAAYFLPSADEIIKSLKNENSPVHAEELLNAVLNVMACLRIQITDLRDGSVDVIYFEKCFESVLVPLFEELSKCVENAGKEGISEHALSVGVFVLMLVKENKIGMWNYHKYMTNFFKSMLLQADWEKKSCPNYDLLKKKFPKKEDFILKTLKETIRENANNVISDSSWLYSLPLLHFLQGDSEPFKTSDLSEHRTSKWWGLIGLDDIKRKLKQQTEGYTITEHHSYSLYSTIQPTEWNIPVQHVIEDLHHLFEVDYLLPRTIMATITFGQLESAISLGKIPPYVVAACLFFHCEHFKGKYMDESIKKLLVNLFDVNAEQFKARNETELTPTISEWKLKLITAELCISKIIVKDLVLNNLGFQSSLVVAIMSVCLAVVSGLDALHQLNKNPDDSCTEGKTQSFLENLEHEVVKWLKDKHQFKYTTSCLEDMKVWNSIIDLTIQANELKQHWQKTLLQAFEAEISSLGTWMCDKVLMIGTESDILSNGLKESLASAAFCSFEKEILKNPGRTVPLTKTFGTMLSKMMEKQWPENGTDNEMLHFVTSFKPMTQCFERFYKKDNLLLTETCIDLLSKASSVLSVVTETVCKGNMCVGNLRKVLLEKENILRLVKAAEANFSEPTAEKTDLKHLKKVLEVREKELQACDQYLCKADELMCFCGQLPKVNTAEISHRIHRTRDRMDQMLLTDLCVPTHFKSQDKFDVANYQPSVDIYRIPDELLSIIPQLKKLMKSVLFQKIWTEEGSSDKLNSSLDSVLVVWKKSNQIWDSLCMSIRNGTISFQDVKTHTYMFHEDYEQIKHEFTLMNNGETCKWVEDRIQQLKTFSMVDKCQRAAGEIMQIQEVFNFTGDFEPVKEILNLTKSTNIAMEKMDQSVLDTCSLLKDVTVRQIESLVSFRDSKPLVDWLRTSMKDGLKELKVFVDLAYISAGEGDIEIHKVNCLHAATTGYAPLVFDCDQQCDYRVFLQKCESVWRELKTNSKLPEMLRDTGRYLEWLKEVSQSHGSVEVTSLSQAGMINSTGVYRVGNLTRKTAPPLLDLNHIISLHVKPENCTNVADSVRKYSHDQLIDLQSRLMLVAGRAEKGKENVDQFMMILDGIVRLSKTYIRLILDGCVLFNCWKANFLCDNTREACAILEFGQDSESLKGHRRNDRLEDFINALANIFESCHVDWLKYVSDKRDQYLELNFYTITQLVFLQKELIKIGTDAEPSHLIFPLLSLIKPDCSMADIQQAMQKAKDEVLPTEETEDERQDTTMENEDNDQFCIQEVMKSGFTEVLAQAALRHTNDDIDDAIVWCLEHEDDEEFLSSAVDPVEITSDPVMERFTGWTSEESSFASRAASLIHNLPEQMRKDTSVKSLIRSIKQIWKTFLSSVSSSVADYLSVEHLGIILRKLAESCDQSLNRKLPIQLKAKTPNLMVCQKSDVLNAVLHMYQFDSSQPLPRPDEVLLCTPETTFVEVDIFLRRAFFSCLGKIHCLAYADLLRYEIEEKIEKKLIEYIAKANAEDSDYKLVVLCSSENEFRARIVAALERHRCQPPIIKVNTIKEYLTEKFTGIHIKKNQKSASNVDFSQSKVRVVKSKRAGVGKTLYKKRRVAELRRLNPRSGAGDLSVSIPLYEKNVVMTRVADKLLPCTLKPEQVFPRIFHLNISYEVQEGLDYLLFNLLILGKVTNEEGHIWLRSAMDLYLVEIIPLSDVRDQRRTNAQLIHPIFEVLPHVTCWSPKDSFEILTNTSRPDDYDNHDLLFDLEEFQSVVYQRPFQYLSRWESKASLSDIAPSRPQGTPDQCLVTLLKHCGVHDPSWAELHHFVWFLNTQLVDFERSTFCSPDLQDDLPGFSLFVLRFLIQMSRDFATRSLNMSEETPIGNIEPLEPNEDVISQFQMRRTWESSPHPYIFFNPDGQTMTFLGFNINRNTGDLIDQQTNAVLERAIMPKNLQDSLIRNRVPLNENFDQLQRLQRLEKLCSVMPGVEYFYDPDITYELTTDNVKKILAIFMRFRCNIPVLIMGETGCGKTRLVKFLCSLQCPPGAEVENMVIMKVHGGTTADDIIKKVHKAEQLAQANAKINEHMYTVLFFDEANTTEAIGLIKEIMCDGTMDGQPLQLSDKLKIVAACNPYRKHSDELIERLEKAGLGYHVDAEKTVDRLGRVPMRRLVYRVQPLPQSMLPLVWDFGQLNARVEELYIRQMVNHYVRDDMLPPVPGLVEVVSTILIQSQNFMRDQEDECSFVSLRDVERVLKVMTWFYQKSEENRTLFNMMEQAQVSQQGEEEDSEEEEDEEEEENQNLNWPDDLTKSLILALGVCYRASLRSRDEYDQFVTRFFHNPCVLPGRAQQFADIITRCQDVFLENVQLEDNIARNQALKENLFMMIICIELRIPLFLVGKPGSSKSLAKTIVSDAMQGNSARKELFKELKQAQMVSFQCSPLSVAEGILGTFRQCAQFQKDKDLDRFVSIVVLDEVGLAEDSVRMPLKTLHPLLEDGCQGDEAPKPYKKVAFIGISNWALDPAKMNRGILVQREVPDQEELIESAKGICASKEEVLRKIKSLLPQFAEAYKAVFDKTLDKREFFGLRDFYSLVKMIYGFAARQHRNLCWHQLEHAILRNFGGLDTVDPVEVFREKITGVVKQEEVHADDPINTTAGLIEAALFGDLASRSSEATNAETTTESRYLLLLTENYGALRILQQILDKHRVITIFGSSFPKDQEYTQVCRNINRIKVCMETGNTVILLNLENLYESLYDALNQYYARLGGERFVDLGLGTHRVKCRVHQDFRLIVVAEKQIVYEKFPIPLINRLEKHFLTLNNMMNQEQSDFASDLDRWAKRFVTPYQTGFNKTNPMSIADAFMGYHPDTTAAIVLHMWPKKVNNTNDDFLEDCKRMLLWCATPDSVLRLKETQLCSEADRVFDIYFKEQPHDDIFKYMFHKLELPKTNSLFTQVTTHSKLLTDQEKEEIMKSLGMKENNIILLTLQSFDTEQQFCQHIRNFLEKTGSGLKLLLIQCGSGDKNMSLIKSAQYCVEDELPHDDIQFAVFFIVQLPRVAGGCFTGFMAGKWHSLHIDELRPEGKLPSVHQLHNNTPANVLQGRASREPPNRVTSADAQIEHLYLEKSHPMEFNVTEVLQHVEQPQEEMDFTEEDEHIDHSVVDPENIVLEELHAEETAMDTEPSETDLPPYFQDLILKCIQSAAALVKDDVHDSKRSTKRIEILLHFLENQSFESEDLSFLMGISKMIIRLLQEKEVDVSGHTAASWLSKEAAKPEIVKKAGTFRRSWLQCLENKIVPILAGVVAFLDTNRNLDIIRNMPSEHWTHILWLRILHSSSACELRYQDLLSPETHEELGEIIPSNTGVHGMPFPAELPFSWLLQHIIESGLQNAENTHHEESDDVNVELAFVGRLVVETPYGKLLNGVSSERGSNQREIIMSYVKDFVHTKYECSSEFKHQILCEALEISSRQANMNITVMDLMSALVAVHYTHALVMERLQAFLDIEQVWPEVVEALHEMKEKGAHPLLTSEEMTLDVFGLVLLLEQLEPQKEQLNKEKGRAEWLEKVKTFSPIIQRILDNADNLAVHRGRVCCEHMERARCLWTRVTTIKLFLEIFSPKGSKSQKVNETLVERYMPLWQLLGERADLKKIKSLENVEKFLKSVNKNVLQKLSQKLGSCSHCSSAFEAPPIVLPCTDKICQKCFNDLLALNDPQCPKCHRLIPVSFNKHPASEQRDVSVGYQVYQRCCNTFLMAVVSKLCFGGDTAPEDAVIEKILSYITRTTAQGGEERLQTKQMTVFDDLVDPTPVVRSFLLQLLIHKSRDHVQQHLNDFFIRANRLLIQQSQQSSGLLQFSQMVIQCLEDQLHERVAVDNCEREMKMAVQSLYIASHDIESPDMDMGKLHAIAHARFGLMTLAKYIYRLVIENSIMKSPAFSKMLRQAKELIEKENFYWPKKFFLKQLCREFGTDSYHRICQWGEIPWIAIEEQSVKVKECADRYVVCSLDYQKIRDMVAKTLLGDDISHLETLLNEMPRPLTKMHLLLATHREVTLKYVQPNFRQDEVLVKAVGNFQTFADNSKSLKSDLLDQLLQNGFGQHIPVLNLQPQQSLRDQSIVCMLFHFSLVLRNSEKKKNFLHPLIAMATNPARFTNSLLPTMPQDDIAEITQAIKSKETVVMYRCPNGHAYAITECGRPYSEGKCNECGAKIGGHSHQPLPGNVQDSGIDQTKTGHILGDASQRPNYSTSERKLTCQASALLRLLTHAALLLGCDINEPAVASMVKPAVPNVSLFFWNHIQKDIEQIHRGVGKSVDDIFLMLHFMFHQISDGTPGIVEPAVGVTLQTKEERDAWEEKFANTFISPILQNMDRLLQTLNDKIMKDKRFGQDELLNILYEVDTKHGSGPMEALHNIPDVWRYRSRITLDHFLRQFQLQIENTKTKQTHLVLRLFSSESYYLQAMRYIPSILALQRHLMLRFRRRLDRAEAYKMTIKDALKFENHGIDIQKLFDDFASAWECVKEKLLDYGCWSLHGGLIRLPEEYRNVKITTDSKLAILLPSTTGPGLCSYILLEFLLKKHNEFMNSYCGIIKQSYNGLPEVLVKDLRANHLICYHPDKDLLPLVLANCNYSFKLGEGTKVDYHFGGFESQLKEMVLQAKSRVQQQKGIINLETMLYRADTANAIVFKTLRDKVKQEALSPAVRLQVSAELHASLPDICDSIVNLDIAVCFLKSLGDDGSQSLQQFMTDVLKMKQTITSQKARQVCRFKHVQSLWLLLNLEKSQVLAAHNQDAFDNLSPDLKKDLSENQSNDLVDFCHHHTLNKLEFVLQKIFDCVLLRIAQPQDQSDEEAMDFKETSLRDIIYGDIDSPLYAENLVETLVMEDMANFPRDVNGSQATSAWLTVYKQIEDKRKQAL